MTTEQPPDIEFSWCMVKIYVRSLSNIYERLETLSLEELRLELVSSSEMELIRQDLTQLNSELRKANQEGIDLYLKSLGNKSNKDYTEGGTLTNEEALKNIVKKTLIRETMKKLKKVLKMNHIEVENEYIARLQYYRVLKRWQIIIRKSKNRKL